MALAKAGRPRVEGLEKRAVHLSKITSFFLFQTLLLPGTAPQGMSVCLGDELM